MAPESVVPPLWQPFADYGRASVFYVDLKPDPGRETSAMAWLDASEKARWRRFSNACAQREFVLCRAALRDILRAPLDCRNRQLSFEETENDKPLAHVHGDAFRRQAVRIPVSPPARRPVAPRRPGQCGFRGCHCHGINPILAGCQPASAIDVEAAARETRRRRTALFPVALPRCLVAFVDKSRSFGFRVRPGNVPEWVRVRGGPGGNGE